jgi:hypothetical protein
MTDKKWLRFNHLLSLARTTAPLNPEGIRGDVCRFPWRPEMFTFHTERSPDSNFLQGQTYLKEITHAENHDVSIAGSSGEILR